jgi:hypothetical protein
MARAGPGPSSPITARAVYDLLRRETAFHIDQFLNQSRDGTRAPDPSLDAHGISLGMMG